MDKKSNEFLGRLASWLLLLALAFLVMQSRLEAETGERQFGSVQSILGPAGGHAQAGAGSSSEHDVLVQVWAPESTLVGESAPDYVGLTAEAVGFWQGNGYQIRIVNSTGTVDVTFVESLGTPLGHSLSRHVVVEMGGWCLGEWTPYSERTMRELLKHELGHVLGLPHSEDPADVMAPAMETAFGEPCKLASAEFIALEQGQWHVGRFAVTQDGDLRAQFKVEGRWFEVCLNAGTNEPRCEQFGAGAWNLTEFQVTARSLGEVSVSCLLADDACAVSYKVYLHPSP